MPIFSDRLRVGCIRHMWMPIQFEFEKLIESTESTIQPSGSLMVLLKIKIKNASASSSCLTKTRKRQYIHMNIIIVERGSTSFGPWFMVWDTVLDFCLWHVICAVDNAVNQISHKLYVKRSLFPQQYRLAQKRMIDHSLTDTELLLTTRVCFKIEFLVILLTLSFDQV